jgi:hypothetical protein
VAWVIVRHSVQRNTNRREIVAMTVEDALRKIELLRRLSTDKGAVPAEREAAYRLQKVLMERYAIKRQEVPEGAKTNAFRLNWTYWQELFDDFDLRLNHFGNRGSAEVGRNSMVYITLGDSQWRVDDRTKAGGWQTTVRDKGIDSLRAYLKEHAPKSYSFARR